MESYAPQKGRCFSGLFSYCFSRLFSRNYIAWCPSARIIRDTTLAKVIFKYYFCEKMNDESDIL